MTSLAATAMVEKDGLLARSVRLPDRLRRSGTRVELLLQPV